MQLNEPLSQPELDELEAFLESDAVPGDTMNLPTLHGFLTAIVVGPAQVLPSEWLSVVWGEEGPLFESEEEAQRISALILRFFNSIISTLEQTPDTFVPVLYEEDSEDGEAQFSAEDWCIGFSRGVGLRAKDWELLVEDKENFVLLTPIVAFSSAEAMAELFEKYGARVTREKLISFIPPAVEAIYDYWKPQRQRRPAGLTLDRSAFGRQARVGRNEPCPCGSGKKYKKCCGARAM